MWLVVKVLKKISVVDWIGLCMTDLGERLKGLPLNGQDVLSHSPTRRAVYHLSEQPSEIPASPSE